MERCRGVEVDVSVEEYNNHGWSGKWVFVGGGGSHGNGRIIKCGTDHYNNYVLYKGCHITYHIVFLVDF